MTTTAAAAGSAFKAGRRRRLARSSMDTAVDGLIASGGLMLANAAFGLGVGLPEGAGGSSLGASLLLAGIAWLTRSRGRSPQPRRAEIVRLRRAYVNAAAARLPEVA